MITVICGSGENFGTGHIERMKTLCDLLSVDGLRTDLIETQGKQVDVPANTQCVILDARDMTPPSSDAPIIAIDNRNELRQEDQGITYHDTIPHPNVDFIRSMDQCLIDPELIGRETSEDGGPLVYAGSFYHDFEPLGAAPRLAKREFFHALSRCSVLVTYFGMAALQAMYLGKKVVLIQTRSKIHNELGLYLSSKTGVPFLSANEFAGMDVRSIGISSARPSGEGFMILKKLIHSTVRS